MYFLLSWRNIWRNKKRTLIVASSVFFAVILATVQRSAQTGSYSYMIHSSAKMFTGYLQIQQKDYWEKRSLNTSFELSPAQLDKIKQIPHVSGLTPRLEAFALVSHVTQTKVAQVVGIDPRSEDAMTGLNSRLIKGSYPGIDSGDILIAEGLAQMLQAGVGDSLIIYGQGFHGQTAAASLPIGGIVKLPFEIMNNGLVFLPLPLAQDVFSMGRRITSLPIMIDKTRHMDEVLAAVKTVLTDNQTIMTWDKMLPELKQDIEFDNIGGIIMLAILYVVIGFGVYGTVMMMVTERAREFGILISVGMRKKKLLLVTSLETLFVAFLGAVAGMLVSLPIIQYLSRHPFHITGQGAKIYEQLGIEPIFAFSNDPHLLLNQALVVFIIALISATYPVLFIRKLNPTQAIRD